MQYGRVLAALGSVALALSTASSVEAAAWLTPADPALPGAAATNQGPAVAMSPNGNLVVGWLSADAMSGKVSVHLVFRPAGGPAEAPKVVTAFDGGNPIDHLSVAVNDRGDAIAAWQETATVGYALHRAGQQWSGSLQPPQYVFTDTAADPAVGLAADGTATLAYGSQCNSTNHAAGASGAHVYVMALSPSDVWSTPRAIDDVLNSCGDMTIYDSLRLAELPDGRAIVAARRASTDGTQRFAVLSGRRESAGADFTATTETSSNHPDHPVVAIEPGGATVVAWAEDGGVVFDLHPRTGSEVMMPIGVASSVTPEVAFGADGEALVVFSPSGGSGGPSLVRISPAGAPGSAQALGAGTGDVSRPVIAADSTGRAVVAYRNAGDNGISTWLRSPGGALAASDTLGTGADAADYPMIATDGAGDFPAVWLAIAFGAPDIATPAFAVFDAAGPSITGLSVPSMLTDGATGDFGAVVSDVWGPVSSVWAFGDGATAAGPSAQHAFTAGSYNATLTAADGAGNATTAGGTVTVAPPAGGSTPPPAPPPNCQAPVLKRVNKPAVRARRGKLTVATGYALHAQVGAACSAAPRARIVLFLGKKALARTVLSVRRGSTVALKLVLTKNGARMLLERHTLKLRLSVSLSYGAAQPFRASKRLTVRSPKR